jgi:hypothetical protein
MAWRRDEAHGGAEQDTSRLGRVRWNEAFGGGFRVFVEQNRDRLMLGVVLIGDLKRRGLKVELELGIDLGTQAGPPLCVLARDLSTAKYTKPEARFHYDVNFRLFF